MAGGIILVFSPIELVRDALGCWLREDGHQVELCAREEDAAAQLGSQPVNVFVTTELVPRGRMLPTLAALRESRPETAIVYVDEGPLRDAREALLPASFARVLGVDCTVPWPFDHKAVTKAVDTVTAGARHRKPPPAPLIAPAAS